MESQILLGALAAALGVVGYALYFRSIFRGETKPHFFTWFVYFLLDIIIFSAQVLNGAGPGAWVTFTGLIGTFCVSVVALRSGERHITTSDWVCFVSALAAIVLWKLTDNALVAVIIATIINFLGLVPTYRKSFVRPQEESVSIWILDIIRFSIGAAALSSFTYITATFPLGIVVGDVILVAIIWVRRAQLRS